MKRIFKVYGLNSIEDVNNVRKAIADNEGILACEISKEKSEISVVFDDYFVNEDKIIECIEDKGYSVL